jgi:hypothetical protein
VLKHTNNLLVLAICIRNARECGNILQVREKQVMRQSNENLKRIYGYRVGRHNVFGIATGYGLGGLGIESRWGAGFSAPVQTGPEAHSASCTMGTVSFPGVKSGRGVTLTPHLLLVPWS